MGFVIRDRSRIDHAAAGKGQAGLPRQPGNLLRDAEPQGMRTVRCHRLDQGRGVLAAGRTERDTSARRRELDHRLEPVQAARAGPDDLDGDPAVCCRLRERQRNLIGTHGERACVARNEDLQGHRCVSATIASIRAASSRPIRRPSSMADGAVAHSPRQ